jgi:hypothetical protein
MWPRYRSSSLYEEKWLVNWSFNGMKRELVVRCFCKSEALETAKSSIPSKAKINKIQQVWM